MTTTTMSIELATGAHMPLFGLGTWQAKNEDELSTALRTALDCGYRLIDTAFMYQNESIIGPILDEYFKSGKIKRQDIFITTKLPPVAHRAEDVEVILRKQLAALHLDYVDLYLIHVPVSMKRVEGTYQPLIENGQMVTDTIDHLETWRAMEAVFNKGLTKAIGLSNFNQQQIQRIIDNSQIKPHNLQIELHLYLPEYELHKYCRDHHITVTAYAPIGSPGRRAARPNGLWPEGDPMSDPIVQKIAQKHHKTPAQILLRQLVERNISVIPKSINADRIKQNFQIFDFSLDANDRKELESITTRIRLFIADYAFDHPEYPFKDVDRNALGGPTESTLRF